MEKYGQLMSHFQEVYAILALVGMSVFRTEIIDGWDGCSYLKKCYSPQVNGPLRSCGLSLCFNPGDTHSGSRRVLSLQDALGIKKE